MVSYREVTSCDPKHEHVLATELSCTLFSDQQDTFCLCECVRQDSNHTPTRHEHQPHWLCTYCTSHLLYVHLHNFPTTSSPATSAAVPRWSHPTRHSPSFADTFGAQPPSGLHCIRTADEEGVGPPWPRVMIERAPEEGPRRYHVLSSDIVAHGHSGAGPGCTALALTSAPW